MAGKDTVFISRAGADAEFAGTIALILREAGYETILQQEDFGHKSFMHSMDEALKSGARVVGLLSPEYQKSEYCAAEWRAALTDDPNNKNERLILFRVLECMPDGLLKPIPFVDLVPIRHDLASLSAVVLDALKVGRKSAGPAATWWRGSDTIYDPEDVYAVPSFTGRATELASLRDALFAQMASAATQTAVVHGLGGAGKSALARQYAWLNREAYSVVWWMNAETENGIIEGLLRFGAKLHPGIDKAPDRREAAKTVVTGVLGGFERPVLLVFDNLEDQSLLRPWRPPKGCHALVTSRVHGWAGDVSQIQIGLWPPDEAIGYLMKESGRRDFTPQDAREVAKNLDCLPLALAHAAAYLRHNPATSVKTYLSRIERHLREAPRQAEYPKPVFATFQEALAQAEEHAPGAAAILCIAAFFAPDSVPFELFEQKPEFYPAGLAPTLAGGKKGASLQDAVADAEAREKALGALADVSSMELRLDRRVFSQHRLVQAACRDLCGKETEMWIAVAVAVANAAFPYIEFRNWALCARLAPHAETVASHAPDQLGDSLSRLLFQTASFLHERADWWRAEPLFRRALKIVEAIYGPDHTDVATCLSGLAGVLRVTNRLAEAEPLYRRALKIDEANREPNHPNVAIRLNNLGLLLLDINHLAEAELLFRRALELDDANRGPNHPDVAIRLNNLAELLRTTNRFLEAEPLFRRALKIDEANYGTDHPHIARDLNNLALLLQDTDRLSEAEPLLLRALKIDEVSYGYDHPNVAVRLSNFAELLRVTKRFVEAEPLYRRALKIVETSYGPNHPMVATGLNNLASLLQATNRFIEAEALLRRAFTIVEASYGPNHPLVARQLNNLGGLFRATNRLAQSEPFYRLALQIFVASYGPVHRDVAICLNNLADLLAATGRLVEAIPSMEHAAEIFSSSIGPEHPNTKAAQQTAVRMRLKLAAGSEDAVKPLLEHNDQIALKRLFEKSMEMVPLRRARAESGSSPQG